jgi:glycosyltransferase involved in cell wall biosynthesis
MNDSPEFSVCIVTRNRPDDLASAIRSVEASRHPALEIIVSDDSTDDRTARMVAARYPRAVLTEGPRRGLSANRNHALSLAHGTHVLFIDDDVTIDPEFLGAMADHLREADMPDRVILTGTEINDGQVVMPRKLNFLGFMAILYGRGDRMYSTVINATIFPRSLFTRLRFDEALVYGYDEIDIAARAVFLHDHEIRLYPGLSNHHFPSGINRDYYSPFIEASRIYVTFKIYHFLQRKRVKALAFLVLAVAHNLLFNLRRRGLRGIVRFGRTTRLCAAHIGTCLDDPRAHV